jgi:hypothetical protein
LSLESSLFVVNVPCYPYITLSKGYQSNPIVRLGMKKSTAKHQGVFGCSGMSSMLERI